MNLNLNFDKNELNNEKNWKQVFSEMKKISSGITLIALVITIIVLLILAGVSIATLTGDNGILKKAQTAKEEAQKVSEEEQRQLATLKASMNTKNYDYPVEDGKITIPTGFAPTGIEGENSIKDGVVITDENGNEFVWIPCTQDEFNKQRNTVKEWKTEQSWYNGGTWGDGQPNRKEIQDSIKNNGGFYIGRYEAGIPENAPFYASKDGDTYYTAWPLEGDKNEIIKNIYKDEYKPVSKQGVPVWNLINQKNAKDVAENMVKNNGVQSYLIDSHTWDTTCRVIEKYAGKNLTESTDWGNNYFNTTTKYETLNTLYAVHYIPSVGWNYAETYNKGQVPTGPKGAGNTRLELSTGACEEFRAYNIYDLAGNVWEWTTENGNKPSNNQDTDAMQNLKTEDISDAAQAVMRGRRFQRWHDWSIFSNLFARKSFYYRRS